MRVSIHIAILFVLCCVFSRAHADITPARILVGTSEVPLAPSPVHDGTQVLAPPTVLGRLGATASESNGVFTVTNASGQTGTIRAVELAGRWMLPMDKVMEIIGGSQVYDVRTRTLTLLATLDSVEFDDDTLKVNCSFPVHASARPYDGRLVVDVAGTRLASEAREVYIGTPAVERARLNQYSATTTRVVLDMTKSTGYELQTRQASAQVLVKIADGLTPIAASDDSSIPGSIPSITVTGVSVEKIDDRSCDVVVSTSGKAYISKDFSVVPPRIVIGVKKARIGDACSVTGSHSLVKPELVNTATGVKLTLSLARPADYSVETNESAVTVRVRPLQKSGGTLADKHVVIDPGHGGSQKGACAGGAVEKVINMQIAKEVASALQKHGAKVTFSRDSDVLIEQRARAEVAINRAADFFISIHCNSSPVPGSATGIETYYHMQGPSPKTLAYLIHDGVCKYTGMCDRNARSDSTLYSIGLGVLRTLNGSGIPGILLECGYINNSSDRAKLSSAAYRSKLANGIVTGLKAYVEGTTVQ